VARDRPHVFERGEEAAQAAIEDRYVPDEQQVAQPQRPARPIEDREVGIGVRRRPGTQAQHPPAQVEVLGGRDQSRRDDDRSGFSRFAEITPQRVEVVRAATAHRIGKAGMADEFGTIVGERRIAEDVIRMSMGVDHVAHRNCRNAPDRKPQRPADRIRSARVDDRHAARADDKARLATSPKLARVISDCWP
jgi:hypothetical protein